jgi:thioredoxin-related protein
MKKIGIILLALFTAQIMVANMTTTEEKENVEWKTISEALDQAPKTNKKIILDVYTDWCGWCKRMDRDTYADSAVAAYMQEHYIGSKMNPEKSGKLTYDGKEFTQQEFGQALGINGYPATAVFNEKGELLTVIPGYIKAAEFLRILKYFGEDSYLSMQWNEYMSANPLEK